jgi:CDP-glucose 4,6-dehydratase
LIKEITRILMNISNKNNLKNCFSGRTVVVSGHTGFKGSWLITWLKLIGAKVVGLALDPATEPSHFIAGNFANGMNDLRIDVTDRIAFAEAIISAQPDFVFHLAAQALVRRSYEDPIQTWNTNVMGTLYLLEALRNLDKPCSAVIITSDKCYENVEWFWGYRETDALGGADPYSASKAAAELVIRSHIKSYFPSASSKIRIASARAGNVVGGGDWSEDRIVPDCVRAWSTGNSVALRSPHSTRPWQHVLEPLSGYLNLAMELNRQPGLHGEPFNFGPNAKQNYSVLDLVNQMALHWKQVHWQDVSDSVGGPYESSLLKLNCDKALHFLQWYSVMNFEETARMTADWYREYYEQSTQIALTTKNQIVAYTEIAKQSGLKWAQ